MLKRVKFGTRGLWMNLANIWLKICDVMPNAIALRLFTFFFLWVWVDVYIFLCVCVCLCLCLFFCMVAIHRKSPLVQTTPNLISEDNTCYTQFVIYNFTCTLFFNCNCDFFLGEELKSRHEVMIFKFKIVTSWFQFKISVCVRLCIINTTLFCMHK